MIEKIEKYSEVIYQLPNPVYTSPATIGRRYRYMAVEGRILSMRRFDAH
jgi:hypothetical protein